MTETDHASTTDDGTDPSDADDPAESERQTIAALYEFCAGVLADPPGTDAVEHIVSVGVPEPQVAPNDQLARGFELLDRWRLSVDDPDDAASALERSHTRLFVGPRPTLQIHESYYGDDYLGKPLARVQGSYAELGIEPAPDLREEADHAAVELAALAVLTRREAEDPTDKEWFLREHGWWFDDLAADVDEAAADESDFYRGVGAIVGGLVRLDAERLEIDLETDEERDRKR